jgi:hypothetical protein
MFATYHPYTTTRREAAKFPQPLSLAAARLAQGIPSAATMRSTS